MLFIHEAGGGFGDEELLGGLYGIKKKKLNFIANT